ncbi:DNA alkylation repair protein [Sediminibacterium roseum]|uniref:DNA alkylation repair protein n=1 Tax=Sediminibacterium roseum TaxID=1978412 RepID=A0ABW9ZY02_9BACT|nr:DNA alkylation repair protein [Sediminibacterium roseum]NCI50592.1 DNA alkylation repair protein [Sediminibacterium roseum]
MHPYLIPVSKKFKAAADAEKREWMKSYMLNQFDFFGVPAPARREIAKTHVKQHPLTLPAELEAIVKDCFQLPQRELQYFGIQLFALHKKLWNAASIGLIEHCLLQKSWWDTVDGIASEWLTAYFKMFPQQIVPVTSKWNRSANIWLQRSSIMFQKAFKKDTDTALLSKYILNCAASKEFFIQKAIGWALREYGKVNGDWVRNFVKEHTLAPLSVREARTTPPVAAKRKGTGSS